MIESTVSRAERVRFVDKIKRSKIGLMFGTLTLTTLLVACSSNNTEIPSESSSVQKDRPAATSNPNNLPPCEYDIDGRPGVLSPGEDFIVAEGAWVGKGEAYLRPVLKNVKDPRIDLNTGVRLDSFQVNGAIPDGAGGLWLTDIPRDPETDQSFKWVQLEEGHSNDQCSDPDPNVALNPYISTRHFKGIAHAAIFGNAATPFPYPSSIQYVNGKIVPQEDAARNSDVAGLRVVSNANLAAAGLSPVPVSKVPYGFGNRPPFFG